MMLEKLSLLHLEKLEVPTYSNRISRFIKMHNLKLMVTLSKTATTNLNLENLGLDPMGEASGQAN